MAKITKHAAFLETLHSMVTKEAAAGTEALQHPGKDTNPVSVSKETEHVDKNKEGKPEHNPQEFKQHPASDSSDPTKSHGAHHEGKKAEAEAEAEKTAEKSPAAAQMPSTAISEKAKSVDAHDVKPEAGHQGAEQKKHAEEQPSNEKLAALGAQLLATVEALKKEANVANNTGAGAIKGTPGGDTHPAKVDEKTEHVNKNEQGHPEHNPQGFHQKPGQDPTKKAELEVETEKQASFELGRQFARSFLLNKSASYSEMHKEAGRRDFETLIATAAAELDKESKAAHPDAAEDKKLIKKVIAEHEGAEKKAEAEVESEAAQIKQAEEAGAAAFYELYKQAQEAEAANQIKVAFEQQIAAVHAAKEAAEKRANELAAKIAATEAEMQKKAEEEKLDAKLAQWGRFVVEDVINRLKNESAK